MYKTSYVIDKYIHEQVHIGKLSQFLWRGWGKSYFMLMYHLFKD